MRSERGMTLLEVLVVLMLLALTGLLLSGGMSLGSRVWERAGTGTAAKRAEGLATLRRLVEQAEPPGPLDDGDSFAGEAESVGFATHAGARLAGGMGQRVELYRDPAGDAVRLRIAAMEGEAPPDDLPMMAGVTGLSLRYYGYDEIRGEAVWSDRWQGRTDLPLLIEFKVAWADGSSESVVRAEPRRRVPAECLVFGSGCPGQRP